MSLSGGAIAGLTIGLLVGIPLAFYLVLILARLYIRGPTKGTDNRKRLDGRLVVVTGKQLTKCGFSLVKIFKKSSERYFVYHV